MVQHHVGFEKLEKETKALEEATKAAVDKGKRGVERAQKKVLHGLNKHVLCKATSCPVDADSVKVASEVTTTRTPPVKARSENNFRELKGQDVVLKNQKVPPPVNRSEEGPVVKVPSSSPAVDVEKDDQSPDTKSDNAQLQPSSNTSLAAITAKTSATPADLSSNSSVSPEMILTIYTAIISAYHAWACKSDILANKIPISVVLPFVALAFLFGYNIDGFLDMIQKDDGKTANHQSRGAAIARQQRRGGGRMHRRARDATTPSTGIVTLRKSSTGGEWEDEEIRDDDDDDDDDEEINQGAHFLRTKNLVRRGRNRFHKLARMSNHNREGNSSDDNHTGASHHLKLFSTLGHHQNTSEGVRRDFATKVKAPFTEGPLMDHLLKYKDFRRSKKIISAIKGEGDDHNVDAAAYSEKVSDPIIEEGEDVADEDIIMDISLGHAKLNNTKAESLEAKSLESNSAFSHVVDPMLELRGMDMFLTDDPDEDIWRQPYLNECGLRDTPTLIANMMMPHGNMTTYLKLPDWVDDWNNIPEEKEDDPIEVKALKVSLRQTSNSIPSNYCFFRINGHLSFDIYINSDFSWETMTTGMHGQN